MVSLHIQVFSAGTFTKMLTCDYLLIMESLVEVISIWVCMGVQPAVVCMIIPVSILTFVLQARLGHALLIHYARHKCATENPPRFFKALQWLSLATQMVKCFWLNVDKLDRLDWIMAAHNCASASSAGWLMWSVIRGKLILVDVFPWTKWITR